LLTLAAAAFVALHPGSARVADSLCGSLAAQPADLADVCGGAIKHLADTPAQARDGVRRLAQTPSAFRIYGLRLALALLPVVGGFLQLWQSRHVRRPLLLLGAAGILSAVASIPLFLYAIDWGRWLYIHIVCLALLLFVIDRERRRGDAIPAVQSSTTTTPILRLAGACALLLYALTWNLPHVATDPNRDGYVGLLRSAISSKSS
jgi:hypothetical protein